MTDDSMRDQPDLLLHNSLMLMGATAATSGLGFLFWIAAARSFSEEQLGVASPLLSGIQLLAYLSLFGLNGALVRFLGTGRIRDRQVTQSMLVVTSLGALLGIGYVVVAPRFAAELLLLWQHPIIGVVFVLSAALAAANLLTDSIFVALRAAEYNMWIKGILQSCIKLLAVLVTTSLGVLGIFGSGAVGMAVAAAASLFVLRRRFGVRWALRRQFAYNRVEATYSLGSYIANVLSLLPQLVVPIIILSSHGSAQQAYYFTAWQVATLVYSCAFAIAESQFSEACRFPERYFALRLRSAKLMVAFTLPLACGLFIASPLVLAVFGSSYAEAGEDVLRVLAVVAIPQAVNAWASFLLRIRDHILELVLANLGLALGVVGLTYAWRQDGLERIGWAWFLGNWFSAAIALVALHRRRSGPATHSGPSAAECHIVP